MGISNWNAQAIVNHLYTQINAAKDAVGLAEVSKEMNKNITDKEDLMKYIATRQKPFLYITLLPGTQNPMDHETEAGIETRITVGFFGYIEYKKSDGPLKDRIDLLVKNLLDFVVARDEFRGGLATEVFPSGYTSTEESLHPFAFFQINFDFTFTWIKE